MLKKIAEYNSSTSQEITVYFKKVLKAFKPMQTAISNLTNAPSITAPEAQPITAPTQTTVGATKINEEKAGEQTKAEVLYT